MLLTIHPTHPEGRKIQQVVELLKKGAVIVYPTDTIYTFGCDLYNKKAIEKIARIKGKKTKENHFSIVCEDFKDIAQYATPISNPTFKMMKRTLPGPFTYILNANKNVPKLFDFKKHTVGVRVPDHAIPRAIVHELGNPLISTSVHNEEDILLDYLTDPEEIYERYYKLVDVVIDGGVGDFEASTIVDVTGEEPVVLREGKGVLLV